MNIILRRYLDGEYQSRNAFFHDVKLQPWADGHLITGRVNYGEYLFGFKVKVLKTGPHKFTGSGNFILEYKNWNCPYPIDITIENFVEGMFIESEQPRAVPIEIVGQNCGKADPIETLIHPDIFKLLKQ